MPNMFIYIYAFGKCFYPKRPKHILYQCGIEPVTYALQTDLQNKSSIALMVVFS